MSHFYSIQPGTSTSLVQGTPFLYSPTLPDGYQSLDGFPYAIPSFATPGMEDPATDPAPVEVGEDTVSFHVPANVYQDSPSPFHLSRWAGQSVTFRKLDGIFKYARPEPPDHLAPCAASLENAAVSLVVNPPVPEDPASAVQEIATAVSDYLALPQKNLAAVQLPHFWQLGEAMFNAFKNTQDRTLEELVVFVSDALLKVQTRTFSETEQEWYAPDNLNTMIRFFLCFNSLDEVKKLAQKLQWGHFEQILKLDDPFERTFYAWVAWYQDWQNPTRLKEEIRYRLYHRSLVSRQDDTAVQKHLDHLKNGQIDDLIDLKDLYLFPFVEADFSSTKEIDLEAELVDNANLKRFLEEMGIGTQFNGNQVELSVPKSDGGTQKYWIDVLLQRRGRHVIIELKKGKYQPAYIGTVIHYREVYKEFKTIDQNKAEPFCILLVSEKDDNIVKFMSKGPGSKDVFVALWRTKITPEEVDELVSESLLLSRKRALADKERLNVLLRQLP